MIRSRIRRLAIGRSAAAAAGMMLVFAGGANAATSTTNPDGSTTISDGGYSFVNYQLGALPAEYCPDINSPCQNNAAEPAIRADRFGNFFGSSENGLTSGTEAWKSIDGGRHYVHLPSPNQLSSPTTGAESGISPAGGDTDLATASAKNAFGIYNVYVASLEGTSTDVSTSRDGGHTWSQNNLAGIFPGEDREWTAADGSQKVCISYLTAAGILVAPAGLHVQCSYDAGTTFPQISDAVELTNADARSGMKTGNLAIDQNSNTADPARNNDILYQIFVSGTVQDQTTTSPTDFHIVWMGVSLDGGKTFKDYQVYNNPNPAVGYAHNFPNVSVDQAGNVYAFFSDNHQVYYKYSTDHGQTWLPGGPTGAPIAISKAPANTAIFPWSSAGTAGKVDLVYYGTSYYDGVNPPDSYPASANWYVYFAQNLNVLGNPSGWTQVQASPINHRGAVCEGGVGCTGNRDLYDDFGVAASPTTGRASIIYSDDQYAQFNHTLTYPSNCTAANDNTGSCDHTSIATQIGGPVIFGGTSGGGGGTGGSGCREADGGGDMAGEKTGTAHAAFDGDNCKDGDTDNVQAHDAGAGEDFQSTRVDSIQFDDVAHSVTMAGTGLSNGKTVAFEMVAVNNGTLPSTIFLALGDGYTLSGPLLNGTVTLN